MCSRLIYAHKRDQIQRWLDSDPAQIFEPRYNIAPTQWVDCICVAASTRKKELTPLRWGLLPPWATELATGNMMINARAETLYQKSSFRNAIQRKRCVIPVSGFYEWQRDGKKRKAFLVRRPDHSPFILAGLWEYNEAVPEGPLETFTIITTSANGTMRPIHDRMPVLIPDAHLERWLDPKIDGSGVKDLLTPAPDDALTLNRVSDYVNNVKNEGPECIAAPRPEQLKAEATPEPDPAEIRAKRKDAPGQGMLFD